MNDFRHQATHLASIPVAKISRKMPHPQLQAFFQLRHFFNTGRFLNSERFFNSGRFLSSVLTHGKSDHGQRDAFGARLQ
ncbi:hypothetical protein SAMN06265222_10581 [Neorhodopirellula lusitana]|uniref:Uncharacterized protein n=1 Tax=Neorhodopirellula lusitana TaxID=445327 RepID=A0ABY1Q141_9BACT|nr:hypothetical protein SAMN06265222_10581 [Neorhodopirellula lusitana]